MQSEALKNSSPEMKLMLSYTLKRIRDEVVSRSDDFISGKLPAYELANAALKGKEYISAMKTISELPFAKKFEKFNSEARTFVSEYSANKDNLTKLDAESEAHIAEMMEKLNLNSNFGEDAQVRLFSILKKAIKIKISFLLMKIN